MQTCSFIAVAMLLYCGMIANNDPERWRFTPPSVCSRGAHSSVGSTNDMPAEEGKSFNVPFTRALPSFSPYLVYPFPMPSTKRAIALRLNREALDLLSNSPDKIKLDLNQDNGTVSEKESVLNRNRHLIYLCSLLSLATKGFQSRDKKVIFHISFIEDSRNLAVHNMARHQ